MIREARKLYDLGFGIHWLKPRSKMPVNAGWTTGDRAGWKELEKTYRDGMNVGVRLGKPSGIRHPGKADLYYLAVIDCDVKSTDKKHEREMLDRLSEIFGGELSRAAQVKSGRGNGSRHFYVTSKEPAQPKRVAQSPEKVRVKMPSVKPSKHELSTLSEADLKAGIRLRPAWEISVMGQGQQVVLPPSIHPDSGKAYAWVKTPSLREEFPLVDLAGVSKTDQRQQEEVTADFEAEAVDLVSTSLSDEIVDLILTGKNCEDRSAGLFSAALAMCRAGMSDREILSVLTDRDNYLGEAGYDHAQTNSRKRAAKWIYKYTLKKARFETDAANDFDENVDVEDPKLDEKATEKQLKTLTVPADWRLEIERTDPKQGSRPKNTLKNVILILSNAVSPDVFKRNEFRNVDIYGVRPPWGGERGAEIQDIDIVRMKRWLADFWSFEPSDDRLNQAVAAIADRNRFHPVREYLDGLEWDGVSRIDHWLKDYLGAHGPESYLQAVSRKVLVAMVARIYRPGTKFDHVLILENVKQGIGKSTSVRKLAGDEWFSDAHINIADKDAVLSMNGVWAIELGELAGMRKADVDQLKEFISRTTDRIRVPYGKRTENFPRQCIFIGTTNSTEYLRDTTGNRRFWPVSVGECDFDAIEANRDQLFAEAKFAYELGEPLYLDDPKAQKAASIEQEKRTFRDSWVDTLQDFFAREKKKSKDELQFPVERFTIPQLFDDFGPLPGTRDDRPNQMRAGEALRSLGFERRRGRTDDGDLAYFWGRPRHVSDDEWNEKRSLCSYLDQ